MTEHSTDPTASTPTAQSLRPGSVPELTLERLVEVVGRLGQQVRLDGPEGVTVTGISIDSREVQPGDLYVALPGAKAHGAQFADAARRLGARAVLTDQQGADLIHADGVELPRILVEAVRPTVGPLAAEIYGSRPSSPEQQRLFAVTGTNGKTTTTYMLNSVLAHLGLGTGLIGTIEILAGGDRIPSRLTTPESTEVHALITAMRERGLETMSMEVSSHALDYRRVDGVRYDVAGFTNLTQDHLDLHGSMDGYFDSKAQLFTPERARRGVVVVDGDWGRQMAARAAEALGAENVVTLQTGYGRGVEEVAEGADWTVTEVRAEGIGHRFALRHRGGRVIRTGTGLPADFNVSNAALAAVMVAESGLDVDRVAEVLADPAALTPLVPGRMQVIGQRPVAIVDFAHNPDALERALEAVRPAEGRLIIVFGATGERDSLKRPLMGRIAAEGAEIVLVTDDDPHGEDPAPIREAVADGARAAREEGARAEIVEDIAPRADAIRRAVELAGPQDAILVAGRGHEVSQEIAGVDHSLDDREELRRALAEFGHETQAAASSPAEPQTPQSPSAPAEQDPTSSSRRTA